jgi:hypothetical protein
MFYSRGKLERVTRGLGVSFPAFGSKTVVDHGDWSRWEGGWGKNSSHVKKFNQYHFITLCHIVGIVLHVNGAD